MISLLQLSCDREVPVPEPEVEIVSCSLRVDGNLVVELSGRNCDKMFAVCLFAEEDEPTKGWVRFNGTEAKNGKITFSGLLPGCNYMIYAVSIQDADAIVFSTVAKTPFSVPSEDNESESGTDTETQNIAFFADLVYTILSEISSCNAEIELVA